MAGCLPSARTCSLVSVTLPQILPVTRGCYANGHVTSVEGDQDVITTISTPYLQNIVAD
jgi:hypothetical protein